MSSTAPDSVVDTKTAMMAGRLIIVCGLPGAGKTTHAKALEQSLGAVRLCADDWMDALGFNLWNESARAKVEALQWTLGRRLLTIGQSIVIEWGTWARSERDALREEAGPWAQRSSYTSPGRRLKYCSSESNGDGWRIRRSRAIRSRSGFMISKLPRRRKQRCTIAS